MALVFVRLRAKLLVAALGRSGISGTVAVAFAVTLAVAIGLCGAFLIALLRAASEPDRAVATSGALAVIFVMWVLGPVATAGADEGIPLAALAPFPLARRQRMVGLMCAACVSFGTLVTVLALTGFVVAWSVDLATTLVALLAAALFTLMCVTASRLTIAAVSLASRRRRWRDLVAVAVPTISLGFVVATQVLSRSLNTGQGIGTRALLDRLGEWTRFFPSTLLSGAVADVASGAPARSAARLLAACLVIFGFLLVWDRVVETVLTRASDPLSQRGGWRPLFRRTLRLLPRSAFGAVAAKELRLTWRDPRRRMALVGGLIGGSMPVVGPLLTSTSPQLVLFGAAASSLLLAQQTNQFAYDGRSLWLNVSSGVDVAADVRGRQAALAAIAGGVFAAATTALAIRTGSTEYVLTTAATAIAAGGVALGLVSYVSVTVPVPLPDDATNPMSLGGPGRKVAAIGPSLAVLAICGVVATPFLIAAMTSARHLALDLLILAAGAAVGAIGWMLGTDAAVRSARAGLPELLEAVDPRAS